MEGMQMATFEIDPPVARMVTLKMTDRELIGLWELIYHRDLEGVPGIAGIWDAIDSAHSQLI